MRAPALLVTLAAVLALASPAAGAPAKSAPSAPFADLPPVVERTPSRTVADVSFSGLRSEGLSMPRSPRRAGDPAPVFDRLRGYVLAGDSVTVTTRATPVRVAVVRVDRRGRPLWTLSRATVAPRSSRALRLPEVASAFHEIRVTAGARTRRAYAYTPRGASAGVFLDRQAWRAGEQLAGELVIDGDVPLLGGVCGAVEELRGGVWGQPRTRAQQACMALGVLYGPGERRRIGTPLFDDLPPGRYRYRWSFAPRLGGEPLEASAEFDVG